MDPRVQELRKNIEFIGRNLQAGTDQQKQLQGQLAHTRDLLATLPAKAAVADKEAGAAQYRNLMSESEKQWLIKIQAKQMCGNVEPLHPPSFLFQCVCVFGIEVFGGHGGCNATPSFATLRLPTYALPYALRIAHGHRMLIGAC